MNTIRKQYNEDLTGKRHGRLTVIRKADTGISQWVCKCDCGKEKVLTPYYFYTDLSCGCLERENAKTLGRHNVTHGKANTRLYHTWCKMKERCNNPNIQFYYRYGGRGIKVCDEWNESFESFYDWAIKSGYDENLTGNEQSLDRIDPNGNYNSENCRWITHKEQCRNRTYNRYIDFEGKTMTIAEFCETTGIGYHKFVTRWQNKGFTGEEILKRWEDKHRTD